MCWILPDSSPEIRVLYTSASRQRPRIGYHIEVVPDPEYRGRIRQVSALFFRIRTRSLKFVRNRTRIPELLFNFGSGRRLCGDFFSKTWVNFCWIDDRSRSLNRNRILKFKRLPDPDPVSDSKILEQERCRSLKKWLRPPLISQYSDTRWEFRLPCISPLAFKVSACKIQCVSDNPVRELRNPCRNYENVGLMIWAVTVI